MHSDMIIRNRHKHVDASGQCYLPYLSNWRSDICNLVGLVYAMCQIFGQDPPVYARPPESVASQSSLQTSNMSISSPPTNPPSQPQQNNPKQLVTNQLIQSFTEYSKKTAEEVSNFMQLQDQLEKNEKSINDAISKFESEAVR